MSCHAIKLAPLLCFTALSRQFDDGLHSAQSCCWRKYEALIPFLLYPLRSPRGSLRTELTRLKKHETEARMSRPERAPSWPPFVCTSPRTWGGNPHLTRRRRRAQQKVRRGRASTTATQCSNNNVVARAPLKTLLPPSSPPQIGCLLRWRYEEELAPKSRLLLLLSRDSCVDVGGPREPFMVFLRERLLLFGGCPKPSNGHHRNGIIYLRGGRRRRQTTST